MGGISMNFKSYAEVNRGGFRGGEGGEGHMPPPPLFCNHFEEPQTALFEVELIINNAPLTYVHPNTVETCLTPNHLLFHKQLFF